MNTALIVENIDTISNVHNERSSTTVSIPRISHSQSSKNITNQLNEYPGRSEHRLTHLSHPQTVTPFQVNSFRGTLLNSLFISKECCNFFL
jgi:hypothetical protein